MIVTLRELMEKRIDENQLIKFALRCANCNHRDLLINFLREEKELFTSSPIRYLGDAYYILKKKYEKQLRCPKCKSSLIIYDEEFANENVLIHLKEDNG